MSTPTELEATVTKASSKLDSAVVLLYEKIAREYELTPDEVREATITIKKGEITVKVKGKKDE
jgi:hypothetical protein